MLGKVKEEFTNNKKETAESLKSLEGKIGSNPSGKSSAPSDGELKKDVEQLKQDFDSKFLKDFHELVDKQNQDKKELESSNEALRKELDARLKDLKDLQIKDNPRDNSELRRS